ncbi:MAG: hypothetical protein CME43_01835 [Haliea sp.]|uniref:photosystem I reaction center subunit IV n=1 Tax=Haliea sp. TaxID=1932666 RepID=UPI000C44D5DF|nr:photosystem I reaction center subunit IV [Haliea sp.]MBM68202.1 hypothetical protein [Haliea sp.]|tara:strand:- start:8178 stop:8828 length:651 start_codon:yes stop_codon:yes gene_type:complete
MCKFKVGDKVRLVNTSDYYEFNAIGEVMTIDQFDELPVLVKFENEYMNYFKHSDLELIGGDNMCKFKVGDKVKRKDGELFSNGEQVLTIKEVFYDANYDEWSVRFKETGTYITESKLDLVFTKSDLKDGMVVTYRDRQKRVLFEDKFYNMSAISAGSYLTFFNDDLTNQSNKDLDIIKVEYMGEVLWERKEEPKKVKLELEVTPEQAEMIKKQLGV